MGSSFPSKYSPEYSSSIGTVVSYKLLMSCFPRGPTELSLDIVGKCALDETDSSNVTVGVHGEIEPEVLDLMSVIGGD
jgi:hypothetical protein